MSFESELSSGNFCIPECTNCQKIIWPEIEYCPTCFGKTSLRKGDFEGKILEFSMKDNDYFCIVEFFDKVRIIAKILRKPSVGEAVSVSKCGINDGSYFFEVN